MQNTDSGTAAPDSGMLRVFLSYSRADQPFVLWLAERLTGAGFQPDFDQAAHDPQRPDVGISAEDEWWQRLQAMITAADVMVFVVSPDSAKSRICDEEIAFARSLGKRIIPILRRSIEFSQAPPRLAALNVRIDCTGDTDAERETALRQLTSALRADVQWLRQASRLARSVAEWDGAGRSTDRLLIGAEIEEAEAWSARRPTSAPPIAEPVLEYIAASRAEAARRVEGARRQLRRQQRWQGLAGFVTLIVIGLTALGAMAAINTQTNGSKQVSLVLASASMQAQEAGDGARALKLAVLASKQGPLAPIAPLSEAALTRAMNGPALLAEIESGFQRPVGDIRFSPSGAQFVTVSSDGEVAVWDTATRQPLRRITGGTDDASSLAISPDGRYLAVGGLRSSTLVQDLVSGTPLSTATDGTNTEDEPPDPRFESVAFSGDGEWFAGSEGRRVSLRKTSGMGTEFRSFDLPEYVVWVALSPSGDRISVVDIDGTLASWATTTGALLFSLPPGTEDSVIEAHYASDGSYLLAALNDMILTLNPVSGEILSSVCNDNAEIECDPDSLFPSNEPLAIAPPPPPLENDEIIVTATQLSGVRQDARFALVPVKNALLTSFGNRYLDAYDIADGWSITDFGRQSEAIVAVLADSNASKVLSILESGAALVSEWTQSDPSDLVELRRPGTSFSAGAVHPDGSLILTADWNRNIQFWQVNGLQRLDVEISSQLEGLSVSDDGHFGVLTDWTARRAHLVELLTGDIKVLDLEATLSALNSDASTAALADGETVRFVRLPDQTVTGTTVLPEGTQLLQLRFSADGKSVVASAEDDTVWIISTANPGDAPLPARKLEHSIVGGRGTMAGNWLLLKGDEGIEIIDLESGQTVLEDAESCTDGFLDAALHPSLPLVAVSCEGYGDQGVPPLKILNFLDGETIIPEDAPGYLLFVRFNQSGDRLIAVSEEGDVGVWQSDTGLSLFIRKGDSAYEAYEAAFATAESPQFVSLTDGLLTVQEFPAFAGNSERAAFSLPEAWEDACLSHSGLVNPVMRTLSADDIAFAPILAGREGEDVCAPPQTYLEGVLKSLGLFDVLGVGAGRQ